MFIDDSAFERMRVREALPVVFVPEWPENKMLYRRALLSQKRFEMPSISEEDIVRTDMYIADRKRESLKAKIDSVDDWLKTLCMKIQINPLNDSNLTRTVQLLNKTNQMNLTTRRMSDVEMISWLKEPGRQLWTVRVRDKLGDLGLVGIMSIETVSNSAYIVDFILSCRAMGRKVEETMVYSLIQSARKSGLQKIVAKYRETNKNKPCFDFWIKSGFKYEEREKQFVWDLGDSYILPQHVVIESYD
jgi:FkbH-like protein